MGNSCKTRNHPQDSDHPPWLQLWPTERQVDQAEEQEGSRKRKRNATGSAGPPTKWSGWSWRRFRRRTQHEDESYDHHAPRPHPDDTYDYTRGPAHHVPSWDEERAFSLRHTREAMSWNWYTGTRTSTPEDPNNVPNEDPWRGLD